MSRVGANPLGYPAPIWARFREAPRAGRFDPATPGLAVGQAGTRASDSVLRLELVVEAGRIADARFQAYGCPASIAVGAWLAEAAIGQTPSELQGLRARDLVDALEIPEDRLHCALMGEDALRAALQAISPR